MLQGERADSRRDASSELLTVREVAASLGVCRATVYALCERGELVHMRVSNAIRVQGEELAAYRARVSVGTERRGRSPSSARAT